MGFKVSTISKDNSTGFTRRRALAALSAAAFSDQAVAGRPPRVLFVCQSGTVKSPFARELARREAQRRKLAALFRSRGLAIEDHVSPRLAAALEADGIDLGRKKARRLTDEDLRWADLLVAFDPTPAPPRGKLTLDWSDTPSLNDRYAEARALIERRLGALLTEIAGGAYRR
ncbi:MAG: hypothetical protein K2Q06_01350 [Parvularculaceae bacterium]|nr:hypothetical protein [Parvularculaceae bacterium]